MVNIVKNYFSKLKNFFIKIELPVAATIALVAIPLLLSLIFILKDLPAATQLSNKPLAQSTKILDRNGKTLYKIYVGENRTVVTLNEIPLYLRQATIAVEDKDFYKHGGINIIGGILRAAKDSILYRRTEGGSTITQQLIKISLLTPERTIIRKIREAILAFWTEQIYSKDQILAMYLNRVPYGGTAYGVEEASEIYFNKHVKELTLSEATILAGLPVAPTYYSPYGVDPQRIIDRQHHVLDRMAEDGYISKAQAEITKKVPVIFASPSAEIKAPHFVAFVKEQLVNKYGEEKVEQGGLSVVTTLDLDLQEYAQASLSAEVAKQKDLKVGNGGALVTNPKTGEILAMVGSANYEASGSGKVNVTIANRSPGSSIKPLVFALGFLKGTTTPATAWADGPYCFPAFNGKSYCPQNYDGKFHGVVQTRFALGNSLNIPATKEMSLVKVEDFIATASAMGISTLGDKNRYGYSLALGGGEVKMTDMAVAFGVFANRGEKVDLVSILNIADSNGNVLENTFPKSEIRNPKSEIRPWDGTKPWVAHDNFVLPEEVTFLISHILLDDGARAMTFGAGSILNTGFPVSVKTGTAEDKRDNWTIGYMGGNDPRLAAVWVGNNDNSPMSPYLESGNTGAAPIWNKIIKRALEGIKPAWPEKPSTVDFIEVCSLSGMLPANDCPKRGEYFIKAFVPKDADNVWGQKKKILVYKDSHKQPGTNEKPNPDQLTEEEHIVISDPVQKDFCADCGM